MQMTAKDVVNKVIVNVSSHLIETAVIAGGILLLPFLSLISKNTRDFLVAPTSLTIRPVWIAIAALVVLGAMIILGSRNWRVSRRLAKCIEFYKEAVKQPEQEEWENYRNDLIYGIDWRWRWHGTTIESLTALCPQCRMELYEKTRPNDDHYFLPGERLLGIYCVDTECQWGIDLEDDPNVSTPEAFRDLVKKTIRQRAQKKGYDITAVS